MQAFGVTESQMDKAAEMLVRSESTENLGNSPAGLAIDNDNLKVTVKTQWKHRGVCYKYR